MYLYIRTWALIDTGKYLTTIYMVYLYLCSSDAVMQWATPATLFRSHVFALIKTAFFFLLLLSYTDDHKRFMSFDDALSSFSSLMFFKKLTRSVKNGGGRRVRAGEWKHVTFSCGFLKHSSRFFTFLILWNTLHTDFKKGLRWSVDSVFSCIFKCKKK